MFTIARPAVLFGRVMLRKQRRLRSEASAICFRDENTYRARLLAVLVLIRGLRAEYSAATNAFDQALALPPVTSFLAQ